MRILLAKVRCSVRAVPNSDGAVREPASKALLTIKWKKTRPSPAYVHSIGLFIDGGSGDGGDDDDGERAPDTSAEGRPFGLIEYARAQPRLPPRRPLIAYVSAAAPPAAGLRAVGAGKMTRPRSKSAFLPSSWRFFPRRMRSNSLHEAASSRVVDPVDAR